MTYAGEANHVYQQRRYRAIKAGTWVPARPKLRSRGTCAQCGTRVKSAACKYCSLACQHLAQYQVYIERWLAGAESGGRVGGVSARVRRYMIERADERCSQCGWAERNPRSGKVPLEIDHIDGDWRNNRPSNLRLLCPNHHALTPTFKGLNRGYGRPFVITRKSA